MLKDIIEYAACADESINFFPEEEDSEEPYLTTIAKAKQLCQSCPVRRECLDLALTNQERFGIWGGLDEKQMRNTLNIDQYGKPTKPDKKPKCPYCCATDVHVVAYRRTARHLKCQSCHFEWHSRISSNVIRIEISDEDDEDVGSSFPASA